MYQKFVNFLRLDKEQLKLVDEYLERRIFDSEGEDFEFFNDLRMYVIKCFNVLKFQKFTRIGLTVCDKKVVDLLIDYEHEFCSCSKVTFGIKLKEILKKWQDMMNFKDLKILK